MDNAMNVSLYTQNLNEKKEPILKKVVRETIINQWFQTQFKNRFSEKKKKKSNLWPGL